MSTRTFTLEALRTACAKIVAPIWVAPQLEAALLAAKPEAKTCEPHKLGCPARGLCDCNPASAASPPACKVPLLPCGCDDDESPRPCDAFVPMADRPYRTICKNCDHYEKCHRAKAVPRDAAKRWKAGDRIRLSNGTEAEWDGITRTQESLEREGWSAATVGGQPGVPDEPECYLCQAKPATYGDSDGKLYCRPCARGGRRDIGVPVEPSRPVTGEAVDMVKSSKDLSPDDPRIRWPVVFARWSNGDPCGDEATSKDEVENLGRGQWDNGQFNVTLREPITPPAPGNHPGTPESSDVIECKSGNFPYRWMRFVGEVQQGSNDKVTWVQTRPAPGKPDEAPRTLKPEDWHG